jgi:hypothetical protein
LILAKGTQVTIILIWATMLCSAGDPAAELTAKIDQRIEAGWKKAAVAPVERVGDDLFLRRIRLDLAGRIPTAGETRAFLADSTPDKRVRQVDRLLSAGSFSRHWARVLRADWIPQASDSAAESFESWLAGRLESRLPYNQLVRQVVTAAPKTRSDDPHVDGSVGFLAANDFKPEALAASSARQFLGLNLDCAQCHNHPFARWKQDQFWEFAAFFADVQSTRRDVPPKIVATPGGKEVAARFLNGTPSSWRPGDDSRGLLVDWMTATGNPYFARNAVNRLWAYLMGAGLIEPLDDVSGAVAPSHPELLDELADAFVRSDYDVRLILRSILASRAYQLVSRTAATQAPDPHVYCRMAVRPMSAEQLLDSYLRAAGLPDAPSLVRREFVGRFHRFDRSAEPESSVLQSLLRMNGELTSEAVGGREGTTLAVAVESPFLSNDERIEHLYLAVLSRRPTADELRWMREHVASSPEQSRGLADVFWVLLNSAEFALNH